MKWISLQTFMSQNRYVLVIVGWGILRDYLDFFLFSICCLWSCWKEAFGVEKVFSPTLLRQTLSTWRGHMDNVSLTESADFLFHSEAVELSHYDMGDRPKRNIRTALKVSSAVLTITYSPCNSMWCKVIGNGWMSISSSRQTIFSRPSIA